MNRAPMTDLRFIAFELRVTQPKGLRRLAKPRRLGAWLDSRFAPGATRRSRAAIKGTRRANMVQRAIRKERHSTYKAAGTIEKSAERSGSGGGGGDGGKVGIVNKWKDKKRKQRTC